MRQIANSRDLHEHRGPYFDHWRQRSLAALGIFEPPDAASDEA